MIASAGGVNPRACARALLARAKEQVVAGLRVGIVEGDEILGPLTAEGGPQIPITPLDRTEAPFLEVAPKLTSAHVYLGAQAIVEALREGAQIVVTGRCTDTALALAPMIHEFDIAPDDWDALALGTICGHIIECGAQSTGGNYLENWRAVPEPERIGFSIVEISARDRAVITKHETLGGPCGGQGALSAFAHARTRRADALIELFPKATRLRKHACSRVASRRESCLPRLLLVFNDFN